MNNITGLLEIVAKQRMDELEDKCSLNYSEWCKKEQIALEEMFTILMATVQTEELKQLIQNYDTHGSYWSAAVGESSFIQGFIEGYKLAKAPGGVWDNTTRISYAANI